MKEPQTFQELVEWAAWKVIEGVTRGQPITGTLHEVLAYSRTWQPPKEPKA